MAAEHLGLSEQAFVPKIQALMTNPESKQRVMEADMEIARKVEEKNIEFTHSKEEIKKLWIEKSKKEFEVQ